MSYRIYYSRYQQEPDIGEPFLYNKLPHRQKWFVIHFNFLVARTGLYFSKSMRSGCVGKKKKINVLN